MIITITNKIFKYLKLKKSNRKNTIMPEGAESIKRFFSQTLPASQASIEGSQTSSSSIANSESNSLDLHLQYDHQQIQFSNAQVNF